MLGPRLIVSVLVLLLALPSAARNTLVPEGYPRYVATAFPDRIVLIPGADAAGQAQVGWRTAVGAESTRLQLAVAGDSPDLLGAASEHAGDSVVLDGGNGPARHHRVVITGLQPDTLYAYRVAGEGTWSEWFQFRTAAAQFEPFSLIYFGDAQNAVRSLFSRVLRAAWLHEPQARLMLHAGDLVNQRSGEDDDEWGEWFDAGHWLYAMVPSIVVAGNHEYVRPAGADDQTRSLGPHWPAQFPVPDNGPAELPHTVYSVDFQGVRFIVLDSTSALDHDSAELQTQWLQRQLEDNPNRWTIVSQHHPMASVSLGRDNPPLREHWQPLLERYGVDLVLQGHDHTYGRATLHPPGEGGELVGPVYVVSVAGPKMYRVSDQARAGMARVGEDTQLYQIIRVEADRLVYESRTATARLYDAFQIVRDADGRRRLVEGNGEIIPERGCERDPATLPRPTRCWEGSEWGDDAAGRSSAG